MTYPDYPYFDEVQGRFFINKKEEKIFRIEQGLIALGLFILIIIVPWIILI
jgi:hypothetical protein